ncbi:MAG: hypothetical protein FWD71_21215 [Oscillospiraceae bacterium]|nr:hypothetical protein [Oscillospiraceae bacterium]
MEHDTGYNDRKLFNFIYIGIGLIFLIDFNVNTFDFLPDLFGVILIGAGIGKICYINEFFSKAKFYVNIFLAISSVKLALNAGSLLQIYFKGYYAYKEIFSDSVILLLTFIFSAAELFLSVNIFKKIFKGLEDYLYMSENLPQLKNLSVISSVLNIFFFVKFILTFLSQMPALFSDNNLDDLSIMFNITLNTDSIKNMLIPPCFIIQTLFGVFVLSLVIPFFFEISKDKNLYNLIKSKINYILINDIFFVLKRTLNTAFSLFIAGCLFFIDLQFDNINVLPDFMICILFMIGISLIKSTDNKIRNKKLDLYLIINLFLSLSAYISGTIYKIKAFYALTEDMKYLIPLKLIWNLLYHSSVIIFFLIFIEFYYFIKNFQRKHLEFSITYLNKYMTSSEKNFDNNRNIIFIAASVMFSVKTLSVILPPVGIVLFIHSLLLVVFAFYIIRGLYRTREDIYSYYRK